MRRMYSKPQLLEAVESESKLNGIKVFEDIKDKDGHKRFIEGEITFVNNDITKTYAKWSLCGSHLLVVCAGSALNTTVIASGSKLADVELPEWILNKIYPLYSDVVVKLSYDWFSNDYTNQSGIAYFNKASTKMSIILSALTLNKDRAFRIAYDLLIDND